MKSKLFIRSLFRLAATLTLTGSVLAGQAPGTAATPDVAISCRDRIYAAEQCFDTVSVSDPVDNKLLGERVDLRYQP
jgi:hypothetical protein